MGGDYPHHVSICRLLSLPTEETSQVLPGEGDNNTLDFQHFGGQERKEGTLTSRFFSNLPVLSVLTHFYS